MDESEVDKGGNDCPPDLTTENLGGIPGSEGLASLLADHADVSVETLATLPETLVRKLELNLMWMGMHLPNAEAFSDTSMLQA